MEIYLLGANPNHRKPEFDPEALFTATHELSETDDAYIARFELPGIPPGDIKVSCEDGFLAINVERHPRREGNERVICTQIGYGPIETRLNRPPIAVLPDKITARSFNGLLIVTMPKNKDGRDDGVVTIPVQNIE